MQTNTAMLQRLREALAYDQNTGEFRWKVSRGGYAKAGSLAGATDSKGHRQIRFEKKLYGAHRLAWLITYGRWPAGEVDHINRNRSDNRLVNLRECSHAENSKNSSTYCNNTSGMRGVSWYPKYQKYMVYIRANGRSKTLGYYETLEQAVAVRLEAEKIHYGGFAPQDNEAAA